MDTHTETDRWEGFIKYSVDTGSSAIINIPSFMKIGSGIQKLIGGFPDIQHVDRRSLL
jgi:hypothetical protein